MRPNGSYWGAAGEQIDLRSGNLNFTIPLVKAMSRGGGGVGFNLSYNSQNWRQDPGGTWQLGRDVGYGYGAMVANRRVFIQAANVYSPALQPPV